MFIVLLRFSKNKSRADVFMEGHNKWLNSGFEEGLFLIAGSLPSGLGGVVIAQAASRQDLEQRLSEDPFVTENIVTAEILEVEPKKADERLSFLLEKR